MPYYTLKDFGTGNSQVNCDYYLAKSLNETAVDRSMIIRFLSFIGEENIDVTLSKKVTTSVLGTSWGKTRRINLYNARTRSGQNVFVFLHELAHIISQWNETGCYIEDQNGHNHEFARSFELLIDLWVNDFTKSTFLRH
jgi:hypothetical protein